MAVRELAAGGHSVLLTTHYIEEAHTLCSRVALVAAGRVVAEGPPDALVAESAAVSRIVFSSERSIDLAALKDLPGVTNADPAARGFALSTRNVTATLTAVMRLLDSTANPLLDVAVTRPTLEDVFLQRTGLPFEASTTA